MTTSGHAPGTRTAPGTATRAAVGDALDTLRASVRDLGPHFPADTTAGDVYPLRPGTSDLPDGANHGWTTGFWPGQLWLASQASEDPVFTEAAAGLVASFARRVRDRVDIGTHDLGFLYTLSCVTAWRLTGDDDARAVALEAADALMLRFLEPAGIVQAWGDLSDPEQGGRTIIDSLMNMPLLRWATQVTGDPRYADAADRHTAQLRDRILRPDGSTFHTFYWDPVTGEPVRGATEQGSSDGSSWARGQAWGIYGFALAGRETGDPSFLDAAVRCAEYFLAHVPDDGVVYWDLALTDVARDASAAAVAVCALDELAPLVEPEKGATYSAAADRMLDALVADYAGPAGTPRGCLLRHGVYDMPKGVGVDEGNLWGDYFYLEALVRRTVPGWQPYWWVRPVD